MGPPTGDLAFQIAHPSRPVGPSGLTNTWVGTSAQLSWTPSFGVSPVQLPSYYLLEAGTVSGAANIGSIPLGTATSYLVDVPAGTYYVRVRGVNAYGVSDPSNEVVLQGRSAPGAPRSLSESGTGSLVNLQWSPPSSGGPAAAYVLEAGSGPGLSNLVVLNLGNVTSFAANAPAGTYYVRVRAVNARGVGEPSNEVTVRR